MEPELDLWVPLITENELGPAGRAVHASREAFRDRRPRVLVGPYEMASTFLGPSLRHDPPAERYSPAKHGTLTVDIERYLRYHRELTFKPRQAH